MTYIIGNEYQIYQKSKGCKSLVVCWAYLHYFPLLWIAAGQGLGAEDVDPAGAGGRAGGQEGGEEAGSVRGPHLHAAVWAGAV